MTKRAYVDKTFKDSSLQIIAQANQVIDEYLDDGLRLTLRQLYYQFVSRDMAVSGVISEDKALVKAIFDARDEARVKAFTALAGYKFWMFGYHAGAWVKYNRLLPKTMQLGNPFKVLVKMARKCV